MVKINDLSSIMTPAKISPKESVVKSSAHHDHLHDTSKSRSTVTQITKTQRSVSTIRPQSAISNNLSNHHHEKITNIRSFQKHLTKDIGSSMVKLMAKGTAHAGHGCKHKRHTCLLPTNKPKRPETLKDMTKLIDKNIFKKEPDNKRIAKIWNDIVVYGPVKNIFYDETVDIMDLALTI